jgi:hypothetical protein
VKTRKCFIIAMFTAALFIALIAIGVGAFFIANPFVFGIPTGVPHEKWLVMTEDFRLDAELARVQKYIQPKSDYVAYRNHCLRVLTFANYHLSSEVKEKLPQAFNLMATALAYHDVALWTNHSLNYLDPSIERMEHYVFQSGIWKSNPNDVEIMKLIISQHHKFTPYFNASLSPEANQIINAVRKADWADATLGIVRFDLPASLLEAAYAKLPEAGFHSMLAGMAQRLSPQNWLYGNWQVLQIFKW